MQYLRKKTIRHFCWCKQRIECCCFYPLTNSGNVTIPTVLTKMSLNSDPQSKLSIKQHKLNINVFCKCMNTLYSTPTAKTRHILVSIFPNDIIFLLDFFPVTHKMYRNSFNCCGGDIFYIIFLFVGIGQGFVFKMFVMSKIMLFARPDLLCVS